MGLGGTMMPTYSYIKSTSKSPDFTGDIGKQLASDFLSDPTKDFNMYKDNPTGSSHSIVASKYSDPTSFVNDLLNQRFGSTGQIPAEDLKKIQESFIANSQINPADLSSGKYKYENLPRWMQVGSSLPQTPTTSTTGTSTGTSGATTGTSGTTTTATDSSGFETSPEKQAVDSYYQTVDTKGMTPDEFKVFNTAKQQAYALAQIAAQQRTARDTAVTGLESYLTGKSKNLVSDLGTALSQGTEATYQKEIPLLQEKLNAQGLLHSSGLGEALAREKSYLDAQRESQLGTYSANLGSDITNLLAQAKLANSASDVSAMGSAFDIGNQASQQGLQRSFSTADWQREADLAKELGAMNVPQVPQYQSTNPLMSALAGSGSGAATGFAIGGPTGAAWGAGLGAATGLLGSNKGGK